jgi:hypothetical protein
MGLISKNDEGIQAPSRELEMELNKMFDGAV